VSKRPHIPVLIDEVLEFFKDKTLKVFMDGTMGAAGHAKKILETHPEIEIFIGFDKDMHALEIAEKELDPWKGKLRLKNGDFASAPIYLKEEKIDCLDGVLLDLGVSSMQLDSKTRGFSFMHEAPLDMRMDTNSDLTAEKVVNEFPENKLAEIFLKYGEEFQYKKIAKAIAIARKKKRIKSTIDLVQVISPVLQRKRGRRRIHPATLVFQALRIYVNHELDSVEQGVGSAIEHLCPAGRIGVISFHSLEDRIVKNIFRSNKKAKILTKKPLIATQEEKKANPRSRSAKLRFAEKIEGDEDANN
jgi:16S rRNA (cytosine1402-N4)-methyltransferase